MSYFNHRNVPEEKHEQQFSDDAEDLLDTGEWSETDLHLYITNWEEQERRESRRDRLRLAFGVGDLFGTVLGALCILALLALLFSLISWVYTDLSHSFSILKGG